MVRTSKPLPGLCVSSLTMGRRSFFIPKYQREYVGQQNWVRYSAWRVMTGQARSSVPNTARYGMAGGRLELI